MKTNQKQEQRALSVEMAQQGRTWSQKLPWEVWRWPGAVRGAGPGGQEARWAGGTRPPDSPSLSLALAGLPENILGRGDGVRKGAEVR